MMVVSMRWRDFYLVAALMLSASAGLASCSMTSFTQGYRQNYALSDDEVRQIQFYTSDEIVLERSSALQERGNVGTAFSIEQDAVAGSGDRQGNPRRRAQGGASAH